jgi:hypothetical protein
VIYDQINIIKSQLTFTANYNFMGSDHTSSEVDIIVRHLDQKYYQANIADKSSGEDLFGAPNKARTVEGALSALLGQTCAHLGNPPNLIGAGATQTLGSPTVKRGRGRPKSILPSTTSSAVKPTAERAAPTARATVSAVNQGAKRGPGRPKKQDATTPASTGRPIGRPRKSPAAPTSTGRPRGRPRKNPVVTAPTATLTEDGATAPAKRGRGRPKKSGSTPAAITNTAKRNASALGDEEPAANKSRKTTTDEDLQEHISADEFGDVEEAGQTAPFTPQVWFPTYVSRIARVIYHCLADGPAEGLTQHEMMVRTGLPDNDVATGITQLSVKGGIMLTDRDDAKWKVHDEWEDEDE